jgi:hypothetical protein
MLKPDELDRLRTPSERQFLALTPEQRETLKQHLFLVLTKLGDADYHAIAISRRCKEFIWLKELVISRLHSFLMRGFWEGHEER